MRTWFALIVSVAMMALLGSSGCGTARQPAGSADQSSAEQSDQPSDVLSSEEAAKIEEHLSQLSPEDRALALKQKICPVSKELLGVMDTPFKVMHEGQPVFLCCKGCKEDLAKNTAE